MLDAVDSSTTAMGAHFCDGKSCAIIFQGLQHQTCEQAYTGIRLVCWLVEVYSPFSNNSNEQSTPPLIAPLPIGAFNLYDLFANSSPDAEVVCHTQKMRVTFSQKETQTGIILGREVYNV